jgi:hypothetical protein
VGAKVTEQKPGARDRAAAGKGGKKATASRQAGAVAEQSPSRRTRPAPDAATTSRAKDRNQELIALEKDLDRLLFGVREMESMGEFEEHIRAARRVLSRKIR